MPESHKNGRCPVLDLAVWVETREEVVGQGARIRYTFSDKEVLAPTVFHTKAAYTWKAKIVTLAEEMRRKLRNLDEYHLEEEIEEVASIYAREMVDPGYSQKTRMEILKSAFIKNLRQVEE